MLGDEGQAEQIARAFRGFSEALIRLMAPATVVKPIARRHAPIRSLSAVSRSTTAICAGSPLFPKAISTLRTKRSRPMRLIGEPQNTCGSRHRPARQVGQPRAPSAPRAAGTPLRAFASRTCSRGRRPGSRRSHRCGCPSAGGARRDRALVLDRQVGDAAPRIEPVGRGEGARSGRRRGSARQMPQWSARAASGGSSSAV